MPPARAGISAIWLVPLVVAAVAIGIAISHFLSEGPTITIVFKSASGVEPDKTVIKYKDVDIGKVTAVRLTDDFAQVQVTAKIMASAAGLMVDDAKFWVVKPRITLTGVSGLGTLLSGNYIAFEAGTSGKRRTDFVGLDAPALTTNRPGREFVLEARDLGSLDIGSPVYYRRLPVGQVTGYDLAPDGQSVRIRAFVEAPYDKYVVTATRFWNVSGIRVSLGPEGLDVNTESLAALLLGGVAFSLPPAAAIDKPAAAASVFRLYRDHDTAMRTNEAGGRRFVLHFDESLDGLVAGAPVTFLGLPVGEVDGVGLAFDPAHDRFRRRVVVTFHPEQIFAHTIVAGGEGAAGNVGSGNAGKGAAVSAGRGNAAAGKGASGVLAGGSAAFDVLLQRLVDGGLRAQLKKGRLLIGQPYVDFDYHAHGTGTKARLDLAAALPELPTVQSEPADLEARLARIMARVDRLPLDEIGRLMRQDLEALDRTLASVTKVMNDTGVRLLPALEADVEQLRRAIGAVERAMDGANATLLGPDAAVVQELRDALHEFTRAARSVRVLADELERQPSSLIRGKPAESGPR